MVCSNYSSGAFSVLLSKVSSKLVAVEETVLVYIGADWCPDCVPVSKTLGSVTRDYLQKKSFLIYVSCDDTSEQLENVCGQMKESFGNADVIIPSMEIVKDPLLQSEFKTVFQAYPGRDKAKFEGIPRTYGIPALFAYTGGDNMVEEILTKTKLELA